MTAQYELTIDDLPPFEYNKDLFHGSIKKGFAERSSADLWKMPAKNLEDLKIMPGLNIRIEGPELDAHIRGLADSMKIDGYKMAKPVEVIVLKEDGKDVIYVTDGHCRLRAVKIAIAEGAPIQQISVVTLPSKGCDIKDLTVGLFQANSGKGLTAFEKAIGCKRLANFGMPPQEIADRTGITREYVGILLDAITAPMSIVTMIQNGEVSLTYAVEVLRKHGEASVEILRNGLQVAKAAGKKNVSNKFIPGASRTKVIKRQAMPLFDAASNVAKDPAFSQLSAENQKVINDLLAGIAQKEKAAEEKAKKLADKVLQDEALAGSSNSSEAE
jgi:ParB family chromosome partitioning protein